MKLRPADLASTSIFARSLLLFGVVLIGLKLMTPPIPSFVLTIYLTVAVVGILLYISLTEEHVSAFLSPLRNVAQRRRRHPLRIGSALLFAVLICVWLFGKVSDSVEPAAELRTVHPASPSQIDFRGAKIRISELENPLRENPEDLGAQIDSGARIYYSNCFFCHGDKLDGKGIFASVFAPQPADFTDVGTIAQLQESYLFWRISKGGPGLPREAQPWNSAMPAWEDYLTEQEIWQVILFLYHRAGVSPRTWE